MSEITFYGEEQLKRLRGNLQIQNQQTSQALTTQGSKDNEKPAGAVTQLGVDTQAAKPGQFIRDTQGSGSMFLSTGGNSNAPQKI
jgi:hypothetical protein